MYRLLFIWRPRTTGLASFQFRRRGAYLPSPAGDIAIRALDEAARIAFIGFRITSVVLSDRFQYAVRTTVRCHRLTTSPGSPGRLLAGGMTDEIAIAVRGLSVVARSSSFQL
jgi:hypothetical protein